MHAFQGNSPEAGLPRNINEGDFVEWPMELELGGLTDIRVSPLSLDWLRLP
jgi:hypothetical protein